MIKTCINLDNILKIKYIGEYILDFEYKKKKNFFGKDRTGYYYTNDSYFTRINDTYHHFDRGKPYDEEYLKELGVMIKDKVTYSKPKVIMEAINHDKIYQIFNTEQEAINFYNMITGKLHQKITI